MASPMSLVILAEPQRASDPVEALQVEPGTTGRVWIYVRNESGITDRFGLEVQGPAAAWCTLSSDALDLNPYRERARTPRRVGRVTFPSTSVARRNRSVEGYLALDIAPPRSPEAEAGSWLVTVAVTAQHSGESESRELAIEVAGFDELRALIEPPSQSARQRAVYVLRLENQGNARRRTFIRGESLSGDLEIGIEGTQQGIVEIPPGGSVDVRAGVRARRLNWVGRETPRDLRIVAREGGVEAQASAVFVQRAVLPPWLLVVGTIALALVALAIVAAILTIGGGDDGGEGNGAAENGGEPIAPGTFLLRNSNTPGDPDATPMVVNDRGTPITEGQPIVGDWDGDGDDTVGLYADGIFHLSNGDDSAIRYIAAAIVNPATDARFRGQPIVGDWDGDGDDTIGLFRAGVFWLQNHNSPEDGGAGRPIVFTYGNRTGDTAVAGNWDGLGGDSVGVVRRREPNWVFHLRNSNKKGRAQEKVSYGRTTDIPIVGNWNGSDRDTVGVVRPSNGEWKFLLLDSLLGGPEDRRVTYGLETDIPIVGNWDGKGPDTIGVFRTEEQEVDPS